MKDKCTDKQSATTKQNLSDDVLDALLDEVEFVEIPQNFTNKIMQGIDASPNAKSMDLEMLAEGKEGGSPSDWWQWVALIGGGIPALMQVLAFIFSAWNVSSLG